MRALEAHLDDWARTAGAMAGSWSERSLQAVERARERAVETFEKLDRTESAIRRSQASEEREQDEVDRETAEGTMRFTMQTLRLLYEVPGELKRLKTPPEEATGTPEDHSEREGGDEAPSTLEQG